MTVAQLTLPMSQTGESARCAFGTQGRSVGHTSTSSGVGDWEENCIQVFVGGNQNGYGTHADNPAYRTALPSPTPAPPPSPPPLCSTDTALLGPLPNGYWNIQGSTLANQQAIATCNQGYSPEGGATIRYCAVEGQGTPNMQYRWSPGGVYCVSGGTPSPPPAPPAPPAPEPAPEPSEKEPDEGSPWGYIFVLILLGGAVYAAKDKGLGPFAPKNGELVPGPKGGESTIYDTGGDETL